MAGSHSLPKLRDRRVPLDQFVDHLEHGTLIEGLGDQGSTTKPSRQRLTAVGRQKGEGDAGPRQSHSKIGVQQLG